KNKLKMLMYRMYTPLFRLFSPCLALAREIVNTFFARIDGMADGNGPTAKGCRPKPGSVYRCSSWGRGRTVLKDCFYEKQILK
ncbi:hypothetical protein, partial [Chromobacterium alkanivorans]|uniref:hypothetical protein n=1 Tax=Chromobacterium alkanivorans TaxID=1071719 RepID=UPI002169EE9C